MENNQFDEHIKASMRQLEVPFNGDHWQRLESALDAEAGSAIASSKEAAFDAIISGKLENFSSDIEVPDWNRMQAALDQAGIPNKVFDTEVKSKVARINPAYQASHWELLAERLRREKAVKESLFKNKVAEFTILILLLLNFYQYFPDFHPIQSLPISPKTIEENQELKNPPPVYTPTTQNVDKPLAQVPVQKEKENEAAIATTIFTPTMQVVVAEDMPTDNRLFIPPTLNSIAVNGVSSQLSIQQLAFGIDGKTGLTITVPEMTRHLDYVGLSNSVFVEVLPSLQPASLATATVPLGCKKCEKAKIPARFRFGMVAHVGGTSAQRSTSVSQILSTSALTQKGNGYGSGFTLGFKYNSLEIETGLVYAAKSYAPNIDDAYERGSGINLKQFKKIELQTVRIPVNLLINYAVLGKGKLHLYVKTGAAMNAILRAQYDIVDTPQASSKLFNNIAASSRLAKIEYNRGLFGGDTFRENRFYTANFGFGAEYYPSPKWSIFFEPEYNHYISNKTRIGPTQDVINSWAISFGVKASFH